MTRFSAILGGLIAAAISFGGSSAMAQSAHDFAFKTIDGKPLPMSEYKGKAVLVVNTASFCGYTPQYAGLQSLWEDYKDKGLVVLGVPANDFGAQEPGSNAEIKEFCESKYDVTFPLASKETVKGSGAHPFYKWAAATLGENNAPKWNFHKYLVGADGKLVASFATRVEPTSKDVVAAVEKALAK
ncbi:MAG: glutathione peroxidase [Rhodospirillaceae bacterium]|nr:glutathione peroxidase [Rhodospirillaceae bacterium]